MDLLRTEQVACVEAGQEVTNDRLGRLRLMRIDEPVIEVLAGEGAWHALEKRSSRARSSARPPLA